MKKTKEPQTAEQIRATPYWQDIGRQFCKNKLALAGLVMLTAIIVLCAGAPLFTSYDPVLDMELMEMLQPPGTAGHILGTDDCGRDIWARLLYGGRSSMLTGLVVALLASAVGILVGCVSGYFGGWIDNLLMRVTDIMMSFPFLVIAIALMAVLGSSQRNVVIALAIVSWPQFARLTRSQVLFVKEQEYVEAAHVAGFGSCRIIFCHVLPNCMGPLVIQTTLAVGGAILSAASLNFLGLGGDATLPDWGVMLNQGRSYMQNYPYLTTIPGIAISLTVLAVNWIGDGIRDAFDPKLRS